MAEKKVKLTKRPEAFSNETLTHQIAVTFAAIEDHRAEIKSLKLNLAQQLKVFRQHGLSVV